MKNESAVAPEISGDTSSRSFSKARPLAARLGISSKSLFRWAADGRIHKFKLNPRLVVFDVREVIAFIESGRIGKHGES